MTSNIHSNDSLFFLVSQILHISSVDFIEPKADVSTKFKKMHKGYQVQSVIGSPSCQGVFPRAILTTRIDSSDIIKLKDLNYTLKWNGDCKNGFMAGSGTLSFSRKKSYFYIDGYMRNGFFVGATVMESSSRHRGSTFRSIGTSKLFIDLDTHDEYGRYEEDDGYDGITN